MRRRVWLSVDMMPLTRRVAIGTLGAVCACSNKETRLPFEDGGSQRVDLPNGGRAWLSQFDISKTAIDHIAAETLIQAPSEGAYYPASTSPAFTRLDASAVLQHYSQTYPTKAQALLNCSFFERYDDVTELSFPIKSAGKIITGGSSPYGPRPKLFDEYYRNVTLKALVWNDREITVTEYNHKTGGVLNNTAYPNGFVTYDFKDHPANVLSSDPVGQYQLLGTNSNRGGGLSDLLYVLTITKGRMIDGASLLKRNGVTSTVLTVDGGPSTHLWTKKNGAVITTQSKTLPHYLGFRSHE